MVSGETSEERHVRVMRRVADALEEEGCSRLEDMTRAPEVVSVLRSAAAELEQLVRWNSEAPSVLREAVPEVVEAVVKLGYRLLDTEPGGGVYTWRTW